jgi:hypothetical protein
LLSWQEVAAQQLNWWHQLRNGQGGSDNDNGDTNNAKTTTMTTIIMATGSVGINAGTDAAAVLHQELRMQGKRS